MSETVAENEVADSLYKVIHIGPKAVSIPEDWGTAKLNEIARDSEKTFIDGDWVESEDMVPDGEYQLIQLGNIGEGHFKGECDKFVSEKFFNEKNCTLVEEGDLLISRLADPVLRTIIVPKFEKKSITAVDIVVAKVDETEWCKKYIWQLLNSKPLADAGNSLATGSTRQRISRSNMAEITIPSPPLPEQRRIADILSTVDEQIRQTDDIIEETKELRQGLRQDLVMEGVGHTSFESLFVGPFEYRIPQSWDVTTVGNCTINQDSERVPVKSSKREEMDGDIPYYGASGCIDYVDDYLFDGTFLLVSEDGKNLLRRTRPIAFKISVVSQSGLEFSSNWLP
ncbi:restriction endonuclease subunit S [Haloarcula laminariae]|uniref:restriction endonuclease subunit S n=1 Tax=Haloarcula laminariae TaxID=2961577 RepID=UPI002404D2AA|nr:restriction endonuclease subunit S [Halomicroarcula sp. FL173]